LLTILWLLVVPVVPLPQAVAQAVAALVDYVLP
jgi:hypothetical protein